MINFTSYGQNALQVVNVKSKWLRHNLWRSGQWLMTHSHMSQMALGLVTPVICSELPSEVKSAAQECSTKSCIFAFSWTKTKKILLGLFIYAHFKTNFRALIIPIEKVSGYLFSDDYVKPGSWCINQSGKTNNSLKAQNSK